MNACYKFIFNIFRHSCSVNMAFLLSSFFFSCPHFFSLPPACYFSFLLFFSVPLLLPVEVALIRLHLHPVVTGSSTDYWLMVKSWTIFSMLQQYHIYIQDYQWFSDLDRIKSKCALSFIPILSSFWPWFNLTFTLYSSKYGPFPFARMVSPLSPINIIIIFELLPLLILCFLLWVSFSLFRTHQRPLL